MCVKCPVWWTCCINCIINSYIFYWWPSCCGHRTKYFLISTSSTVSSISVSEKFLFLVFISFYCHIYCHDSCLRLLIDSHEVLCIDHLFEYRRVESEIRGWFMKEKTFYKWDSRTVLRLFTSLNNLNCTVWRPVSINPKCAGWDWGRDSL